MSALHSTRTGDGIFKLLMSPGIDSMAARFVQYTGVGTEDATLIISGTKDGITVFS